MYSDDEAAIDIYSSFSRLACVSKSGLQAVQVLSS